jgi:hypothetical protein
VSDLPPPLAISCPPLPTALNVDCSEQERALASLFADCSPSDPLSCFGEELRWAYRFSGLAASRRRLPQLERLRARPAVEPSLFRRWPRFRNWTLTEDLLNCLVGDLVGTRTFLRTKSVFTGPNPPVPFTVFPAPELIGDWIESIAALGSLTRYSPLVFASLAYAGTILSHPYSDGNGRLARGLAHAALANRMRYHCPFLPIGPALLIDRENAVLEGVHLSATGDWDRFVCYFNSRIQFAVELTKRHAVGGAATPTRARE